MAAILVIEDDQLMGDLLRAHLGDEGHAVRVSVDSADAIREFLAEPPDLVLLDLGMPYLDGLDILDALKGDPASRRIPVIVLTARADLGSQERARAAGVDDYLVKPVLREHLIEAVNKHIKRKASEQRGREGPPSP